MQIHRLSRFPLGAIVLSGLPLLALTFLISLFFDWFPLSPEGDPVIIDYIAVLIILFIPGVFLGCCLLFPFSKTLRERIGRHKWLRNLWGIVTLIIFLCSFISGHGNSNSRVLRIARTRMELDQIYTAILGYESEYGNAPALNSNHNLVGILSGKNVRKIDFINFSHWELNSKNDAIDAWGMPIRISLLNPKNLEVRSAGPDGTWGTPDDLIAP